jgi:hypothetical protein
LTFSKWVVDALGAGASFKGFLNALNKIKSVASTASEKPCCIRIRNYLEDRDPNQQFKFPIRKGSKINFLITYSIL